MLLLREFFQMTFQCFVYFYLNEKSFSVSRIDYRLDKIKKFIFITDCMYRKSSVIESYTKNILSHFYQRYIRAVKRRKVVQHVEKGAGKDQTHFTHSKSSSAHFPLFFSAHIFQFSAFKVHAYCQKSDKKKQINWIKCCDMVYGIGSLNPKLCRYL